ncbi:MAG TPA: copper-binding protein [Pirellulales bacterium]|jgi:protein SCO1/2|nr:copper-binding protein [Pirellulales bacterium]
MQTRSRPSGVALLALVALLGCTKGTEPAGVKLYDVTGKVISLDQEHATVTLDHQDIPGLMSAMEMKFSVQSPTLLDGLKPGDEVHGKLQVVDGKNIITQLHQH